MFLSLYFWYGMYFSANAGNLLPEQSGKPGPEQHYRRVGAVSTAIYEERNRTPPSLLSGRP